MSKEVGKMIFRKLSADEKKRLEYETRQRAIRDYNIGMFVRLG